MKSPPSLPVALLVALLLSPGAAPAGPLEATRVPAAAKWVLHVDLEAALQSQIGTLLAREVVDRSLAGPLRDLKEKHGLEMNWRQLKAVTVFGNEVSSRPDEDGVLLLQGGVNFPSMLDKILEDLGGTGPLAKQGASGRARYTLNEEVHGAEAPGGIFAVSRSQARLDESLATLNGRGAHLGSNPRFKRPAAPAGGFLYLSLAEGLGTLSDLPQAALFQQAVGGQLVAGEKSGQAFVQLQLQTKDAAAAAQLHQVLQGLVLLGQMNQNGNPDLLPLLRATQLATNQASVNINLQFPATNLTSRLARELRKAMP